MFQENLNEQGPLEPHQAYFTPYEFERQRKESEEAVLLFNRLPKAAIAFGNSAEQRTQWLSKKLTDIGGAHMAAGVAVDIFLGLAGREDNEDVKMAYQENIEARVKDFPEFYARFHDARETGLGMRNFGEVLSAAGSTAEENLAAIQRETGALKGPIWDKGIELESAAEAIDAIAITRYAGKLLPHLLQEVREDIWRALSGLKHASLILRDIELMGRQPVAAQTYQEAEDGNVKHSEVYPTYQELGDQIKQPVAYPTYQDDKKESKTAA